MVTSEPKRVNTVVFFLLIIAIPALGYCLYRIFGMPSINLPSTRTDTQIERATITVIDRVARIYGDDDTYTIEDESDYFLLLNTLNNLKFNGPFDRPPMPGPHGYYVIINNPTTGTMKQYFVDYDYCVVDKFYIDKSQAKIFDGIFSRMRLKK